MAGASIRLRILKVFIEPLFIEEGNSVAGASIWLRIPKVPFFAIFYGGESGRGRRSGSEYCKKEPGRLCRSCLAFFVLARGGRRQKLIVACACSKQA